jgi:hypothetical protein
MDFADAMLKLTLEPRIVKLLGTIHEARALRALMFCLEKGVGSAAVSIVANVEGMGLCISFNQASPASPA